MNHTTPSWRAKDPQLGFQRIVKEDRARQIARTILDRERAFPNAITLAIDIRDFQRTSDGISIPELFMEVNENQRRVPLSLRWDLVRLVRPAGEEFAIMADELVIALVEREDSPWLRTAQRLDLTLFVRRPHHRIGRRIQVQLHDSVGLLRKLTVIG